MWVVKTMGADRSRIAGDLPVEAVLDGFLEEGSHHAEGLGAEYERLWSDLGMVTAGGKRFRPALLLGAHRAYGGTDLSSAAQVAAAVELLHTAFVIHDDVIDGDHTRRGRPNLSGAAGHRARAAGADHARARSYGDTAGILGGDLALVGAVRAVAECGAPPAVVHGLLDLLDAAVHASAAGELTDVALSTGLGGTSLGEVLTMAELKTAVYSFVLPLQAGAVLAGAPEAVLTPLAEVGRSVGIAFQLQDDLVGVFGDEEQSGKSRLTDLRQGRQTPLIAHARTTWAWPQLAPVLGDEALSAEQADAACVLLEECGSRRFIEELADNYLQAGLDLADGSGLPRDLFDWIATCTVGLTRSAA